MRSWYSIIKTSWWRSTVGRYCTYLTISHSWMFKYPIFYIHWIIVSVSIFTLKMKAQNSVTGLPTSHLSFSPSAPHGSHITYISMKKCSANLTVLRSKFTSLLSTFPFCALWQVLVALGKLSWSCKWTIIAFASFMACECWQCLSGTQHNSLGQRWACESGLAHLVRQPTSSGDWSKN